MSRRQKLPKKYRRRVADLKRAGLSHEKALRIAHKAWRDDESANDDKEARSKALARIDRVFGYRAA